MALPQQSVADQRRDQIFPKLHPLEIERMRRFGEIRSFAAGERLMTAGQVAPGLVVVHSGRIAVVEHDYLDIRQHIVTREPGTAQVVAAIHINPAATGNPSLGLVRV